MAFGAMIPAVMWMVLIPLMVWEAVWKAVGMWKSARHGQLGWFVCIAVFNTVGILPIIYIVFFQKDKNASGKKKR
jgi:hypothetical protein